MAKTLDLLFLGTGAADWHGPAGSGEERKFSSLLLDNSILLDCGETVLASLAGLDLDPAGIEAVLITHSHGDHFDQAVLLRLAELRRQKNLAKLQLFLEESWLDQLDLPGLDLIGLTPGQSIQYKEYELIALAANHTGHFAKETALHFLIRQGPKTILYATDGAWLPTRTWYLLREHELDLAIFDCTMGPDFAADWRIFEHNSLKMVQTMVKAMQANGVLKKNAAVILTHLSQQMHPGQAELEELLQPPLLPAYDGYLHQL